VIYSSFELSLKIKLRFKYRIRKRKQWPKPISLLAQLTPVDRWGQPIATPITSSPPSLTMEVYITNIIGVLLLDMPLVCGRLAETYVTRLW
jgi:hypothetical protein